MAKPWKKSIATLLKILGIMVVIMAIIFLVAHFAIQYGVQAGEIKQFMQDNWLFWLIVRWGIYAVGGTILYRLYQRAKQEKNLSVYFDNLATYQRLIRLAVVSMIIIELVCWIQLWRG